jgi:hypothetical protein
MATTAPGICVIATPVAIVTGPRVFHDDDCVVDQQSYRKRQVEYCQRVGREPARGIDSEPTEQA